MFLSHYRAGSGAVLVESREESRLLAELLAEIPDAPVCVVAAPSGEVRDARTGAATGERGLPGAYAWAAAGPGRVLIVYDWHVLANSPGHWRALIDAMPSLRSPRGAGVNDSASLVVFVGPRWDLSADNPLRGSLPILHHLAPSRESLAAMAGSLAPTNGSGEAVADALSGLSLDVAEQAAAECLAANGGRWDVDHLRGSRRRLIREAGLEIWPAVDQLGGLSGLRDYAEAEILPWIRDPQLAIRRVLCAGVPGVGKSYCARWLAGRLGCECARLSIPSLKAGLVGQSEANLRRALRAVDGLAAESPMVVVIDEIDAAVQRSGLDSGVSSGLFSELLTWLQESTSQALVLATLNQLDALDAAIESRFQARFFFDLPSETERHAVAQIHYERLGCSNADDAAAITASLTEGYSSREISEHVVPSVARRSHRDPSSDVITAVCETITPVSRTQGDQLAKMRSAAGSLRRANDPVTHATPAGRRIGGLH